MRAHEVVGDMTENWCEKESVRCNLIGEAQDAMQVMCEDDQPVVGGKEAQYKQWLFMQQQETETEMSGKYL